MTRLDIDPRFAAAHYQDGRDLHGAQNRGDSTSGDLQPLNAVRTSGEVAREAAYDQIDRYLRNNLDDSDYADYSAALECLWDTPAAQLGAVSVPPEVAGQRPSQDHPESCGSTQPAAVPAYRPMTADEILQIADETRTAEPGDNGYILPVSFGRAIESAVLARVAAAPAAVQPVAQDERVDALMNLVGEWFYAAQNDPAGVGKTNYLNWYSKEAVAVHEAAQRLATQGDTERDAARWRWLRGMKSAYGESEDEDFIWSNCFRDPDSLDAAIDAAMNAQPAGEQP